MSSHPHPSPGRSGPPRWLARIAFVVLWAFVGSISAPLAASAQGKATPSQKEAELRKVNSKIEKVRKSVNADIEKRDRLSVQLRDAELGVQDARKRLEAVRAERIASEGRLRELELERAKLDKELAGERGALAGELRAAYVNGREEEIKLLLNQEDPATFGRMLQYYGYLGRARAERIGSIRDKLEHLALVREKIAAEHARLRELEAGQEREVAALRSAQEKRSKAVASINNQIKSRGGELQRLESQARGLEKLIADLRKALRDVPVAKQAPFEPLKGKLPWPVQQGGSSRGSGSPGRAARCAGRGC